MLEHRRYPRWQVDNRQVRIKLEGAPRETFCTIRDIDYKGMQVSLDARLEVDTYVKFKLSLCEEYPLETEAWVAWRRQINGRNFYGLCFDKLTGDDEEKIYKFLYHNLQTGTVKGGEKMEDRRIFQRFNYRLPARLLDLNTGNEITAETSDVSAKGLGLVLKERVAANTPLEAWLQIPDEGEPLYARGMAVWSKQDSDEQYRIGMDLERADLMGLSRILRV